MLWMKPVHNVYFIVNDGIINGEIPTTFTETDDLVLPADVTKKRIYLMAGYNNPGFSGTADTVISI